MSECKQGSRKAIGTDQNGNVVVAASYNPTQSECVGDSINECELCIHAEMALLAIMPNPKKVLLSYSPCGSCATALVAAGVEVIMYSTVSDEEGIALLEKDGVMLIDTSVFRGKKADSPRKPEPARVVHMTSAQYREEVGLDA